MFWPVACPDHHQDASSNQVGCGFQLQLGKLGTETPKCETSCRAAFCWHQELEVGLIGRGAMDTTEIPFLIPSDVGYSKH